MTGTSVAFPSNFIVEALTRNKKKLLQILFDKYLIKFTNSLTTLQQHALMLVFIIRCINIEKFFLNDSSLFTFFHTWFFFVKTRPGGRIIAKIKLYKTIERIRVRIESDLHVLAMYVGRFEATTKEVDNTGSQRRKQMFYWRNHWDLTNRKQKYGLSCFNKMNKSVIFYTKDMNNLLF